MVLEIASGTAPGDIRITCADTGVGLPDEINPSLGGLGMLIAQVIVTELQSELEVQNTPGGLTVALEFTPDVPDQ